MMTFRGSNVLITGASKGIGRAVATTLASAGLKVWINYRHDPVPADTLREEILAAGGEAAVIAFDVNDEHAFVDAIKTIVSADGALSYLVNNAGITKDKLSLRMSKEDFSSVLDANLTAAFVGCREAFKVMSKARFGSVVNMASVIGEMGNVGQVNYAASKGGLIAMNKSFAKEGGARQVRFNVVAPGFITTNMTEKLSEEDKAKYLAGIPLKAFGEVLDVAYATAFLLSDTAKYITGEVLRVNGGLYV